MKIKNLPTKMPKNNLQEDPKTYENVPWEWGSEFYGPVVWAIGIMWRKINEIIDHINKN